MQKRKGNNDESSLERAHSLCDRLVGRSAKTRERKRRWDNGRWRTLEADVSNFGRIGSMSE